MGSAVVPTACAKFSWGAPFIAVPNLVRPEQRCCITKHQIYETLCFKIIQRLCWLRKHAS